MDGMELLCKLCEMKYMGVVYTFGESYLLRDKTELLKQRTNDLFEHAKKVVNLIKK